MIRKSRTVNMNKLLAPGTIIAALSLAGCAPIVWDKPGATQSEFNVDLAQCQLFAREMHRDLD